MMTYNYFDSEPYRATVLKWHRSSWRTAAQMAELPTEAVIQDATGDRTHEDMMQTVCSHFINSVDESPKRIRVTRNGETFELVSVSGKVRVGLTGNLHLETGAAP